MTLAAECMSIRSTAGLFDLTAETAIFIFEGSDRAPFLQALASNDVQALKPGSGQRNAFLDKKGKVLFDCYLYAQPERLLLITDPEQAEGLSAYLDSMLFAEDVRIQDASDTYGLLALQGPDSSSLLAGLDTTFSPLPENAIAAMTIDGMNVHAIGRTFVGYPSYLLACKRSDIGALTRSILAAGAASGSSEVLNILRIESGIPIHGADFDSSHMLLELNQRDNMLSQNKGCYPGQEVIARTISRGSPRRLLMGLTIDEKVDIPIDTPIFLGDRESGETRSCCWSPAIEKTCVMAYLNKTLQLLDEPTALRLGTDTYEATVTRLPFYHPEDLTDRSREDYRQGMNAYHDRDYEEAQEHFEAAIAMDPYYADAYEALAVMMERQDRHDEAIRVNKAFSAIDPNAIMAHANLSRLYMLKGWIEKAEQEQALAAAIGLRMSARESGTSSSELEQRQAEDRQRRIALFQEVLKMDPEDETANFGLGKLRCDDEQYGEAIRHLSLVVSRNPRYSAAYPLLSRALSASDRLKEAADTLQSGMEVARDQGDMMPLRQMEEQWRNLNEPGSKDEHQD